MSWLAYSYWQAISSLHRRPWPKPGTNDVKFAFGKRQKKNDAKDDTT
jgi:hypothetical protein